MSSFTNTCTVNGNEFPFLKVSFNKEAGVANLHGTWNVSSTGYSYKFAALPELDKDNEIHLSIEEISPTGPQLTAMTSLPVSENFIVTSKTTDVFIHVTGQVEDIFSDTGFKKQDFFTIHCNAKGPA